MASPLFALERDLDPRSLPLLDITAERPYQRLDIGKRDGPRCGLPKDGLQRFLMGLLHNAMIA